MTARLGLGSQTRPNPVPAIAEAEAQGEIAALYADIRATLGVPVVNLIWRHLATIPTALPWAWTSVRALYTSNAIAPQAHALRQSLKFTAGDRLSVTALEAAGLAKDDQAAIAFIVKSYDRSNAMTISTRRIVEGLNQLGGHDAIMPSMYRHLAHWPDFLVMIHRLIAPLAASGTLTRLFDETVQQSHHRGAQICAGMESPTASLSPDVERQIREALNQFVDGPLAKMTCIVQLVRSEMPSVNS